MKVVRIVFGIFAIVGLGLLIGGLAAAWHTRQFLATAVSVPGVVTENVWQGGRSAYHPRFSFRTVDGQELSLLSNTGTDPPSFHANQAVTVLYDPKQPRDASIRSFAQLWLLPTILCSLGAFFVSFEGVLMIVSGVSGRKDAWLRQNGRRIQAEVTRVELNTWLHVNGTSPYRIVCQWRDPVTSQVHIFLSDNIWYDPSSYLRTKTIEVLVDPDHLHRYAVDTSFLPKLA